MICYLPVCRMSVSNAEVYLQEIAAMSLKKATDLFTARPRKYNCAETIAEAFDHSDMVSQMHFCGGGCAPDGICGALHAGMLLVPEDKRAEMLKEFKEKAGSVYCDELKNDLKKPCLACVRIAAMLLEKYGEK